MQQKWFEGRGLRTVLAVIVRGNEKENGVKGGFNKGVTYRGRSTGQHSEGPHPDTPEKRATRLPAPQDGQRALQHGAALGHRGWQANDDRWLKLVVKSRYVKLA